MSEAAIRARLNTIVSGVANIGLVYDYERFTNDWSTYLSLFKTTIGAVDLIRGWTIGYSGFGVPPSPQEFGYRFARYHHWKIRGYLGLDDSAASEKTAGALAEAVCDAIDGDATLNGASYYETTPAVIDVFEQRLFGTVLCHYVEIAVSVAENTDQ